MKLISFIIEVVGWLQIALAPTLLAGLIAFCIYLNWNTNAGLTASICIVVIGFITGAAWATRVWVKYGTSAWLSGKAEKS